MLHASCFALALWSYCLCHASVPGTDQTPTDTSCFDDTMSALQTKARAAKLETTAAAKVWELVVPESQADSFVWWWRKTDKSER